MLLIAILTIAILFIFVGVAETAFESIGFTRAQFIVILIVTLLGSFVNIPITRVSEVQNVVQMEEVRVFWVTYRTPRYESRQVSTTIAINLGGALVPAIVSGYLLVKNPNVLPYVLIASILTGIIVHFSAKKVKGVGIVTPAFLPPMVVAVISLLISPFNPAIVAYVSGTFGTLVGADISNLRGISSLEAKMVSIGGAGTFDGVFLTGIIAVLIVALFH